MILLYDFSSDIRDLLQNIDTESVDTDENEVQSIFIEIKPKSHLFDKYTKEEVRVTLETCKNTKIDIDIDHHKLYHEHFYHSSHDHIINRPEEHVRYTKFHKIQVKKNINVQNQEYSLYSPVHFYANEVEKTKKSLYLLKETPQNNLSIAINGKNPFKTSFDKILPNTHEEHYYENLFDVVSKIIKQSSIINVIKEFQILYDHNIKELEAVIHRLKSLCEGYLMKMSEEKLSYLIRASTIKVLEGIANILNSIDPLPVTDEAEISSCLDQIIRFLLSITFRDCSILLNLHVLPKKYLEIEKVSEYIKGHDYRFYLSDEKSNKKDDTVLVYKIGLVDTEIKPLKSLISYVELDQELLHIYLKCIIEKY